MSTLAKYTTPSSDSTIKQGDIFRKVNYIYDFEEFEEHCEIVQFTFSNIIVLSQSCDVNSMSKLVLDGQGNDTNFMMSILVAPIYDINVIRNGNHLEDIQSNGLFKIEKKNQINSKSLGTIKNDFHYRFHYLNIENSQEVGLPEEMIIDYKHYFTVNIGVLLKDRSEKRICGLEPIFSEQVTLRFSNYLSRVAIP